MASGPGSTTEVGVNSRSSPGRGNASTISLNRSKLKYSLITSCWGSVVSMPSNRSNTSTDVTGKSRAVGAIATGSTAHSATAAPVSSVRLESPPLVTNSATVAPMRTTSPTTTSAGADANTNTPSDVAGSASSSAGSSWT